MRITIGRWSADGVVAGGAVAHAKPLTISSARAKTLAVSRAGLKPGASEDEMLFVRVFEVRVPVEPVFVETKESS